MTSRQELADISYLVLLEIDTLKHKEIWKSYFDQIEKDLEVLEILKDHFIKITFDTTMTKKEKQKIKEWLEK